MADGFSISHLTNRVLQLALAISIALLGGKGGGKSATLALLAIQHCEQFRDKARCLIVRQTFPALEQMVAHLNMFLAQMYGGEVAKRCFNKSEMAYTLPGGGRIELGHVDEGGLRYWGRSVSFLGVDEMGTFQPRHIEAVDMIRTNARTPTGVVYREVITANPGGAAHSYIERHFMREPWRPFKRNEQLWMTVPSTFLDNPFIDQESQRQAIQSLPDRELAQALLTGDWSAVKAGNFFASAWQPQYSIIQPWHKLPGGIDVFWSIDQGGGQSQTVAMLCGIAKQTIVDPNTGEEYPAGTRILIDEVSDATSDYSGTMSFPISKIADLIRETSAQYEIKAAGSVDPQVVQQHGHQSTLLQEWHRNGIQLAPWKRHGREARATLMRQYMANAAPEHARKEPGLYVTEYCPGWLATVPFLPTDKRRRSDIDTKSNDHHYDASAGLWYRVDPRPVVEHLYL